MNTVDLIGINSNDLKINCISAFEYQPKIFNNVVNNRSKSSFLYIIEGEYSYSFKEGSFIASSGNIVYLPKGSDYSYNVLSSSAKCLQIEFECFYSDNHAIFSNNPVIAIKNADSDIENIFYTIIQNKLVDSINQSLRINANIMLILAHFADRLKGKSFTATYKKILPAIDYIKSHFTEKIYVNELERVTNLSASQIRRIFQKEIALSPIEFKNYLIILF